MQNEYMQSVKSKTGLSLDPRTKILVMLAVNLPAFTADSWVVLALAAMIPLSLMLFCRKYSSFGICAVLYALSLLADVFLVDTTAGAVNVVITMVSGVVCRMMPGILMGYFLLTTTTVSEFVASMERWHIPKLIIIPLSVMFRFIPTIKEECTAINDAMRMRGISFGKTRGGVVSLMEYRLVPLLISSVKIGDELSSSALTRGLGSPVKRTNICKIGFHAADMIYILLAVITTILFMSGGGWWQ